MSKRHKDGLTDQRDLFCREFLKDLNQAQAAIRAGYSKASARVTASRLMDDPKIRARIQELMDVRGKRVDVSADYVLMKIHETVERCSQAEPVLEYNPISKTMERTGEWKFEHSGVLKGCELLGKHLKLFTEKLEHSGPNGKPIETLNRSELTDEQLAAKVKALLEKTKQAPENEPDA